MNARTIIYRFRQYFAYEFLKYLPIFLVFGGNEDEDKNENCVDGGGCECGLGCAILRNLSSSMSESSGALFPIAANGGVRCHSRNFHSALCVPLHGQFLVAPELAESIVIIVVLEFLQLPTTSHENPGQAIDKGRRRAGAPRRAHPSCALCASGSRRRSSLSAWA